MENATKALIIAGAVAVSLLILSLGMYFYKQATSGVNLDKLSQAQKDEFNQEFTKYEGSSVSGMNVNELIQKVIRSNTDELANESGKYINLTVDSTVYSEVKEENNKKQVVNATTTKVASGYTYKVVVTETKGYGLIDTITITTNKKQ